LDSYKKNLAEFEDFLKRCGLVPPEKARFYVYWVDRLLKYYHYRPSKPLAQIVSSYLGTIETDSCKINMLWHQQMLPGKPKVLCNEVIS